MGRCIGLHCATERLYILISLLLPWMEWSGWVGVSRGYLNIKSGVQRIFQVLKNIPKVQERSSGMFFRNIFHKLFLGTFFRNVLQFFAAPIFGLQKWCIKDISIFKNKVIILKNVPKVQERSSGTFFKFAVLEGRMRGWVGVSRGYFDCV